MNIDPAASGKLCSLLTSRALLLFERGRSFENASQDCASTIAPPASLRIERKAGSQPPGKVSGSDFLNQPSRRFVFLLLYLTHGLIFDNRHGLPNKFEGSLGGTNLSALMPQQ
jgi:hypothetical protein